MNSLNYNDNKILYPLTHPQKRIWYIEKIYPGTSLYNIGGTVRIKGDIDFCILEESINALIKNNDGIRLRFFEENAEAKQYISYYERVDLDFIDFSNNENPEDEFNSWVKKEARLPFTMENERLFYFALFKISNKDNGYLVKFHHIISDGWSINIMTESICDTYMKLLKGDDITSSIKHSYIDYIANEQKYLLSDRFLKNKLFWNEKFKVLPNGFLNMSSDTIEGKRKTFELEPVVSSKIKKFAADNKYSLNTFFIMLYLLYFYKTTQQEDIVIGTPVYNRSGKQEKSMFGMFTSTMPFRFTVDDNLNVMDTIIKVNKQLKECYFNQKYPYDLLIQDVELKKKGYDNLFNTCVNYYNTKLNSKLNSFPIENVEFYNGHQIYSMQLIIKEWSDSGNLTLEFDYKVNDYSDEQIEDMYARLLNLADSIIMNPFEKLRNLTLLCNDERKKLLYAFNVTEAEYPKDKVIYQLFEQQVEKTPDSTAIYFNNIELTYRKLNEKANQLARYLVKKGIGKETIVGLLTNHSIETVIGILGILKAGGAYLPIDCNYPSDRINYMLKDSDSKALLTDIELSEGIDFSGEIINLDNQDLYTGDISNLECINKPSDLVYVIYTSGSMGKPKGSMIEYQSLVNYIWWAKKMYIRNETEVFPLYSSLAFDLTVTSIFTPLISGSIIAVYDDNSNDEYVLFRIMKDNKATVVKLTPSHLSLLKDKDNSNSSVRRFIVGGEDLKVNLAKDVYESFNGKVDIYNEYGPTETVVGCMIHKYTYESDNGISVPIGVPADNVQIYVLDKNLKPVPINTVGEIYISGDGIARGYLNSPKLTQEKFIDNHFVKGRMYKTGDLAKFLNNGRIEYVGRADQQVKIRGYRIELGEIEKYLLNHEAIKDCLVVDMEEKNSMKYLCAYIVKKAQVTVYELKHFLLTCLPDYMIPLYFIELVEIPLTRNGKLDRERLPKPVVEPIENAGFIEYRNEKEKSLIKTMCDIFNLERVSVIQNFYHLGGDSIKAIQIASKLNEKGWKINVKDILSNPIIEDMALCIEQNKGLAINQEPCEGSIRPTAIVSWFFLHNHSNSNHYNQSVLLELNQSIEIKNLEIILNNLIKHHDSLRINFNPLVGELFYNNKHLDKFYNIQEYDLTNLSYSMQIDKMTFLADELKSSFNIENEVLIKACVFNLGLSENIMLITAHHFVVDGVSWRIILEDINTMVRQINNGERIVLSSKTHSYQEWAKDIENYYIYKMGEEQSYWKHVLSKEFSFPVDYDLGEDTVDSSCTISVQMYEALTECLMTKANIPYNTETKDLLIVALLRTIKELSGSEDIVVELEGHGRDNISENVDVSRTIGWFTSLYPFYFKLKNDNLSEQIKEVKEEIRKIPNKGIGFGVLKYLLKEIDEDEKINKYVRFNFLGDFSAEDKNRPVNLLKDQIGSDYDKRNKLTYILEINCFIVGGELNVLLTYSKNKFYEKTMKRYLDSFMNELTAIINHCCNSESMEFTPSDFDTLDITAEELDSLFI
ncbi:hypothetical protein acsn021_37570 [Anaerocolumna cellulosilytica]|uniref:Uncharacterized protein n=1 Tax=Anaerocolumna cellulosilytica TaxID=433286 RepID=A0A6S6RBB1_9FIRM|nr:non-ribosomal peptide synthetase [Anaerocolumna cellulosilytica]MBB5194976.1 amino acid adenylation domain-containing protein/non-ribosomal peptide synthase protein (TIGR01720 family) [Anaerocolumna cellulosilytica]BCJ96188.1 hypothetical protein acsn021_37570 [Anaerocolumna cellulosilytica]